MRIFYHKKGSGVIPLPLKLFNYPAFFLDTIITPVASARRAIIIAIGDTSPVFAPVVFPVVVVVVFGVVLVTVDVVAVGVVVVVVDLLPSTGFHLAE